jgi:photosystem II stability/assembly factor-like uncharacterized protein
MDTEAGASVGCCRLVRRAVLGRVLAGCALVGSLAPSAGAQPLAQGLPAEVWTPLGPDGGHVSAVRHAPSAPEVVWAQTWAGVFRSADGGQTWELRSYEARNGFYGSGDLEVASGDPARVWVAGADGIWRTDDAGRTWSAPTVAPRIAVTDLLLDATHPDRLYAHDVHSQRLLRSDDAGGSWRQIRTGVAAAAVAPDGTLTLFRGRDVLRTSDGGASWRLVATAPPALVTPRVLVVEPGSPQVLWAATGAQLWRSGNGGLSWRRIGGKLPGFVHKLGFRPDLPRVMYAKVFPGGIARSTDRGLTWTALAGYGQAAEDFSLRPGRPQELLVAVPGYHPGNPGGVWRSEDSGRSFAPAVDGLVAQTASSVAVDPGDPDHLLGITLFWRLWRSDDGGATWGPPTGPVGQQVPAAVAFDPWQEGRAFVLSYEGRLWRSEDHGVSFAEVPSLVEAGCQQCTVLQVDPAVPGRMFAGGGGSDAVYRSLDGGESWEEWFRSEGEQSLQGLYEVVTAPTDPDRLLLFGWVFCCNPRLPQQAARAYETRDGGASWQLVSGLPGSAWSYRYDPLDAEHLLATAADASTGRGSLHHRVGDADWALLDDERSWWRLDLGAGRLVAATRDFEAAPGHRLLQSSNGGLDWTSLGPELPAGTTMSGPAVVVETAAGEGVWVPTNRGIHRLDRLP